MDEEMKDYLVDDYLRDLFSEEKNSTDIVLIGDCQIDLKKVVSVIQSFSCPLEIYSDGYFSIRGSSFFLHFNNDIITMSTHHQIHKNYNKCTRSSDCGFSFGKILDELVQASKIVLDKNEYINQNDVVFYRLNKFLSNKKVLPKVGYPLRKDRIWPNGKINERLFICGYPEKMDCGQETLGQEAYPDNIDEDPNNIEHTINVCLGLMFARKIKDVTSINYSLELLVDGDVNLNLLSGSPVYYFGKNNRNEIFLGFAGMILQGGGTSKIMNFVKPEIILDLLNSKEITEINLPTF